MNRQRAPKAPPDFDDASRRAWRDTWRRLAAQGTWVESDAPLLELYVRALARADRFRRVVEEEEEEGWYAEGSQGQPVPHPAARLAREAESDAVEYAEALLLTPQTRRRAGVDTDGEEIDDALAGVLA